MDIVAVTDRRHSFRPFLEQIESIASAGADMIVLREKDLPADEYLDLALKVRDICSRYRTVFCINTFTDIAETIGSEFVWIPFHQFMKNRRSSVCNVGVSVHTFEEACQAVGNGADFLIYGNVFETSCKPGKEAKGLEELGRICSETETPVYAIGGITPANMESVRTCGVKGVCLMSGLMGSEDPASVVASARNLR